MELLLEIFFEIYLEFMMYIIPEEKSSSEKYRKIAIIIATAVLLGTIALFIWGCILLTDYDNKLGLIPVSLSVIISIVQIVAGIILHNKR